jgi:hypothetical protein
MGEYPNLPTSNDLEPFNSINHWIRYQFQETLALFSPQGFDTDPIFLV